MKNLKIIATGEILQNVESHKASAMVASGEAVEVSAKYDVIGYRDPVKVDNREPSVESAE